MEEENKKQDGFDANQGHGNHIDCLSDTENTAEFISTWLAETIEKGDNAFSTPEPVDCDFGDDSPKRQKIWHLDLLEVPQAYKDIECVIDAERDLVEPLVRLVPIANLKG